MQTKFCLRSPTWLILLCLFCQGCFFTNFFRKDAKSDQSGDSSGSGGTVLGKPLGDKAGSQDDSALSAIYALNTSHAPAHIRPDPDRYMRSLLTRFHDDGATMARIIGRVEAYRPMAGGASTDFSTPPQATYDATALLTIFQLSEVACTALVNPNSSEHGEWRSILPATPDQVDANLAFLEQAILGVPTASLDSTATADLKAMLNQHKVDGNVGYASYVPVCTALLADARSLFL